MTALARIKERLREATEFERIWAEQYARKGDHGSMRRASRCEGKAAGLEYALRIIDEETRAEEECDG